MAIDKRYKDTAFEIQVASVLMHAWAEVEHDLVYKPLSGEMSDDELSILDQINGLVISGEIAFEQLKKAMSMRVTKSNELTNRYEFTNFIVNSLNKKYLNKLKLGNTQHLYEYLSNIPNFSTEQLSNYLLKINQQEEVTISDQLMSMFMNNSDIENDYYGYLKTMFRENSNISSFEEFLRLWIIFEQSIAIIYKEHNINHKKYFTIKFEDLKKLKVIDIKEEEELISFKHLRNNLVHGLEIPEDLYIKKASQHLNIIVSKTIDSIKTRSERINLRFNFNTITLRKNLDRNIMDYRFTIKEIEILEILCTYDFSNKDISDKLNISVGTVKQHLNIIFNKSGVRTRIQLIQLFKDFFK